MENLESLITKYPDFFKIKEREENGKPQESIVLFGFECSEGWFVILDTLLSWIDFNVKNNDYSMIILTQVKEKFGTLSFYYDVLPFEEQEFTTYRSKRTPEEQLEWYHLSAECIAGAVSVIETMSGRTCERCGSTEDVTTKGPGWIVTKCKKCRDEE